ncbi:MAG: hypothetical protein ABI681_03190 [Gemmatimonadales bacterium]
MRIRLGVILVASLGLFPNAALAQTAMPERQSDALFGVDKVKHFFIAGFVESMTFASLQKLGASRGTARAAAIGTTGVVSLGREFHDRRTKGLFSIRDLAWDAIGAGAALLVLNRTQK